MTWVWVRLALGCVLFGGGAALSVSDRWSDFGVVLVVAGGLLWLTARPDDMARAERGEKDRSHWVFKGMLAASVLLWVFVAEAVGIATAALALFVSWQLDRRKSAQQREAA